MSAINHALNTVRFTIPMEVLKECFLSHYNYYDQRPLSLDNQITDLVIRPRVMADINVVSAQTVLINLSDCSLRVIDPYTFVYYVPQEVLQGRTLTSVLSVSTSSLYGGQFTPFTGKTTADNFQTDCNTNDVTLGAKRIADSYSSVDSGTTAHTTLISGNSFLVRHDGSSRNFMIARITVSHDENLGNIKPRSWPVFADLSVLAVKSFVYNRFVIALDSGYYQAGVEISSFRNYLDTISESEMLYQEKLHEVWAKTAFMNDQVSYTAFIRSQFPSNM